MSPYPPAFFRRIRGTPAGLVLGLALLSAGCATKDTPSVLIALPAPALQVGTKPVAAPSSRPGPTLIVGRLELPEYWQSRAVRFRGDGATIGTWPDTYWAERVEIGVSRHLAIEMGQAAQEWVVCDGSCEPPAGAAWRLKVVLPQLDYRRADRRLDASASWMLLPLPAASHLGHAMLRGQHVLSVPAGADSAQAQAEAVSQMIRELARVIAQQLPSTPAWAGPSATRP